MEESEQYINVNKNNQKYFIEFYYINFFIQDTLGLKTLDQTGRIFKYSINADHLRMTKKWFIDNILKFLN